VSVIFPDTTVNSCLTPLSTIFQLYQGGHFHSARNPSNHRKPTTFHKSQLNHVAGRKSQTNHVTYLKSQENQATCRKS